MKKIKFFPEKTKIGGLLAGCALLSASCNSFLDIVPDNVPVIDHAFTNAMEAEKYLFTCYSYLPGSGEPSGNIGMTAGDEIWLNMPNHVAGPGLGITSPRECVAPTSRSLTSGKAATIRTHFSSVSATATLSSRTSRTCRRLPI